MPLQDVGELIRVTAVGYIPAMPSTRARCKTHGVEDLDLHFDDTLVGAQVERWRHELEARAARSERWDEGTLIELGGWPALVVRGENGVELHEQDLSRPGDAPPAYVRGVTRMASWALQQWEIADAYGVSMEIAPPDYLKHLHVCPNYERITGRFVLARSTSLDVNFSGWVVQCGLRCRRETTRDVTHVDASEWRSIPLFTFIQHRPGLVRYLGLPDGFVVRNDIALDDARVLRRRADSSCPATTNPAMLDLAESSLVRDLGFSLIPRSRPEPTDGIVELDFERDRGLWDRNDARFTLDAAGIVRERYGVSTTVAKRTLAHHQTLPMLKKRIRWLFETELTDEQFAAVAEILDSRPADARAAHAAAMRLRESTGKPFAPLFEVVKRLVNARDSAQAVVRSAARA